MRVALANLKGRLVAKSTMLSVARMLNLDFRHGFEAEQVVAPSGLHRLGDQLPNDFDG